MDDPDDIAISRQDSRWRHVVETTGTCMPHPVPTDPAEERPVDPPTERGGESIMDAISLFALDVQLFFGIL